MVETTAIQRSRGMRDILPGEMARVRAIEDAFVQTCREWGYDEIRTPAIEPLHLFTSAGTLSPKALDRVYSFLDWDGWTGERVVLRPDSTIPAARLYAEHLERGRVAKLFYAQNVFRFTDDGAEREEAQCGVELIGATGAHSDVELIQLAMAVLTSLGLSGELHLSHTGIVRGVMAAAGMDADEQAAAYDRLLDGDVTVIDDLEARLPALNAPLRMLFEVTGDGVAYLANIRESLARALPAIVAPLDDLGAIVAALERLGVGARIDAVLARNFEYYSGVVFKVFVGGERLITGGRYDRLLELVAGTPTPASGFGLYVRSAAALVDAPSTGAAAHRAAVIAEEETSEALVRLYELAAGLRAQGWLVDTVEGGSASPDVCITVSSGTPAYALAQGSTRRSFESAVDVLEFLGAAR
jgi:histidyl-tRNA synthetase